MAATYYAAIRESQVATDKRHICVFNGAGSGKVMLVYKITAISTNPGQAAATTGSGPVIPLAANRLTSPPTNGSPPQMTPHLAKAWPVNILPDGRPATPDPPAQVIVRYGHTTGTPEERAFGGGAISGDVAGTTNESILYQYVANGSEQIACPEGWGFEVRQLAFGSSGTGAIGIAVIIGLLDPKDTAKIVTNIVSVE